MTGTEIATIEPQALTIDPAAYFKPQLTVAEALKRESELVAIIQNLLKPTTTDKYGNVQFDGADYGTLPGTRTKTLFQPGAEKLALFFGLTVTAICTEKNEDWERGFFRYTFKATVSFRGLVIRETTRTCHTREKKYAWIWVERPAPSDEEQREMKETETGRWGTKWIDKRKTTVWQERRPNPDPWSLQFVVEAMSQKRAKVAAVKEALAATGYFSKEIDFDDYQQEAIDIQPEPVTTKPSNGKAVESAKAVLSPREETVNNTLLAYFQVEKGEKTGRAFFEGVWLEKPIAEREAEAKRLGLITAPAQEAIPEPVTATHSPIEPPSAIDPREALMIEIQDIIEAAKAAPLNRTAKEVKEEIIRQMTHDQLDQMNEPDLSTLKEGLSLWLKRLRKK